MENCLLGFLLPCVFLCSVSSQQSATRKPTVFAQRGDDVSFTWQLPDALKDTVLVVSFSTHSNVIFFASTSAAANGTAVVTHRYSHRTDVTLRLQQGLVEFTLRDVGPRDAGPYICMRGLTAADVVEACGQTLVVVDAPDNATIGADGALVIGNDVTLHCAASSTSVPRDHAQPMRFRWFEASNSNHGQNGALEWNEIVPGHKQIFFDLDGDDDNVADGGSGEPEPEVSMGGDSGFLSNTHEIMSLSMMDEGRRFACSASQGLGLWSQKSEPFVLRPEWKPSPSDMTLTPAATSVTVTAGGSTHVTCSAICRPKCSIVWQQLSPADDQAVTLTRASMLSLVGVGRHQQGTYRCVASNTHGQAFLTLSLTVSDPPKPWFSDSSHVITVVAVVTVGLALGMTGVAVVVTMCSRRSTPIVWPHHKKASDAVPLSMVENRSNLVSYC